jgi:cobalt/nickel transport system ATP-binding protein
LNLAGLLTGEGDIQVCGMAVEKQNLTAIRSKVGLVFQDSETQLFMPTVLEDVAFGPLNRGLSPAEASARAQEALAIVGMASAANRAPYHLSAGEKKRVAIAGILATDPEVLVLDEPTTFLDPPGQRGLISLLRELPQAKLVVTHDIAFAKAIASRAVFFEKGKIAADGTVDEIATRFDWVVGSK